MPLLITLFCALCCLSQSRTLDHPIHISISEIHYKKETRSLQIMHKIFMDDLEDHIKKLASFRGQEVYLHLGTKKESPEADAHIERYVREHFTIKLNGKTLSGNYIGKEYETDAVWIYVEIEEVALPGELDIANNILLDFYSDQLNFIHFNINGQKKSLRFHSGERRHRIRF